MDNFSVLLNIHRCTLCSYKTRFSCNLESHLKEHETKSKIHGFICHLDPPGKYQCEECQFQSHCKLLLTNHFNTNHKREETRHYLKPIFRYCENCNFRTYSSLILLSHKCNERSENLNFETSLTEDYQIQKKKKHSHQQTEQHTELEIRRFECDQCSYKAKKKADLNRHVLRKHIPPHEIKWFECEKCMYQSKEEAKLRRHVILQHSQPAELKKLKRFKCDRCSHMTKRKWDLKRHMFLVHTPSEQIEWFKCEQCSYKSKEEKGLRRHVLVWHTVFC